MKLVFKSTNSMQTTHNVTEDGIVLCRLVQDTEQGNFLASDNFNHEELLEIFPAILSDLGRLGIQI